MPALYLGGRGHRLLTALSAHFLLGSSTAWSNTAFGLVVALEVVS